MVATTTTIAVPMVIFARQTWNLSDRAGTFKAARANSGGTRAFSFGLSSTYLGKIGSSASKRNDILDNCRVFARHVVLTLYFVRVDRNSTRTISIIHCYFQQ
jgi:hypothetical protein